MSEVAECCGCCFICFACFSVCGRACLWLPCPGSASSKKDRQISEDELYAQQLADEEIDKKASLTPDSSPSYGAPPPRPQDPMVVSWNRQNADPSMNNYPSSQRPQHDRRYEPPSQGGGYPPLDTNQYAPGQRASVMSGATLQGSEEPGTYYPTHQQHMSNGNATTHRQSNSGGYPAH